MNIALLSRFKDWPIDESSGFWLCSPEHPMPKDAWQGTWAHTNVVEEENHNCHCLDCGHHWSEEFE